MWAWLNGSERTNEILVQPLFSPTIFTVHKRTLAHLPRLLRFIEILFSSYEFLCICAVVCVPSCTRINVERTTENANVPTLIFHVHTFTKAGTKLHREKDLERFMNVCLHKWMYIYSHESAMGSGKKSLKFHTKIHSKG